LTYIDLAKGSTIEDIKNEPEFKKDIIRFLSSSRKGYSLGELKELSEDDRLDLFVEHMRKQDVNEATAIQDLYFAKDEQAREKDRLAFGRLMSAWDNVEGAGTGKVKAAGDYMEGLVTSPATLASVFTGGFSKLGAVAATKGTQVATRAALKNILSKQFAIEAAKGAVKPAIVEGAVGYAQIEMQEGAREATIEDYKGLDPINKAVAVGIQAGFGGTVGGISKAFDVRKASQVAEVMEQQGVKIAADKASKASESVKKLQAASKGKNQKKVTSILNRVSSLTETLSKREAKLTKQPLDPKKVLEGDNLKKEILSNSADKNISGGLSLHTIQNITAAAYELGEKAKIDFSDPNVRVSQQLADRLDKGVIETKVVNKIISDYGLSREEFSYIFLSDLSEAGKTLGSAGQLSKKLRKDVLKNLEELSEEGISLYNDRFAAEVADTIGVEKGYGDTLLDFLKGSDAIRIAFMTSQLGTTAANTMFSTARMGIDVVDEVFRQTLKTGYSAVTGKGVPLTNFHAVTSGLRSMSLNQKEASLLREMYARDYPEEYQKIFYDINRAEVATNTSSVVGKLGSAVNFLNSAVDQRFKQSAFYASVDRQLIETQGKGFKEWITENDSLIKLPENIREKAVYDSLDFVFQKGYGSKQGTAGKFAGQVIKLHKEAPFVVSGFLGMPFPRYVANHIEFINDYTPIGIVTGGPKKFASQVYSGEPKDPLERTARQLTGVSLLSGAYYARASQVEFNEEGKAVSMKTSFSDMQFGEEGKILKTGRVAGALAAHQLLGDMMVRWHYDLPIGKPTEMIRDTLDVAGGLGNMGFDVGLTSDMQRAVDEGSWEPVARRFADIAATFTYPTTALRDLQGALDPELSYVPYTRDLMMGDKVQKEYNLLESMLTDTEALNRMVRFLPETRLFQYTQSLNGETSVPLYDPFNGGPVRSVNPLSKQITGIDVRQAPTTIMKEINTLRLKDYRLYSKSRIKNPTLDYLVRFGLSQTLPEAFEEFISEPLAKYDRTVMYEDLELFRKEEVLKEFINDQITKVDSVVTNYYEQLKNERPRAAAAYVRNTYVITQRQEPKGRFDFAATILAKDLGETHSTAAEFINAADSIEEEVKRREEILRIVALDKR
jgi:hypothetical protein